MSPICRSNKHNHNLLEFTSNKYQKCKSSSIPHPCGIDGLSEKKKKKNNLVFASKIFKHNNPTNGMIYINI